MCTKPKLFIATAVATVALLGFGAASLAASIITPATLDDLLTNTGNTYFAFASTLPPLEVTTFTEVAPEGVVAPDARPFAVFNDTTTQTAEAIGVSFGAHYDAAQNTLVPNPAETPAEALTDVPAPDRVRFTIFATLKYTLPEGEVLVSTTRPSDTATEHKFYLGDQAITLANGTPAWASTVVLYSSDILVTTANKELYFPNQVIWAQGDLLITVASPLPMERLQELAAQVVMK